MTRLRLALGLLGTLVLLGIAPLPAQAADSVTVSGRVTDSAGTPISGVTVLSITGLSLDGGYDATTTDTNGRYRFDLGPDGSATWLCAGGAAGSTAVDRRFNVDCAEIYRDDDGSYRRDVRLYRKGTLRGTVTNASGAPVAGATVHVCQYTGNSGLGQAPIQDPDPTTTTRADGTYSLLSPAGYVAVTVSKPGYATTDYRDSDCAGPYYGYPPATYMPVEKDLTGIDVVLPKAGDLVRGVERPYVAGTPHVGWTLTARPGIWNPKDVAVTYQWTADGSPIDGATSATYAPTSDLLGSDLGVDLVVRRLGYVTARRTVEVGTVTAAPKTPSVVSVHRPYAAGTPKVGWKLTARPGTWSPAAVTVTYRWTVGGRTVSTAPTFRPTASLEGKTLSLTATAAAKGYKSASRTVVVGTIR